MISQHKKRYTVDDPWLNEFIFHTIATAPEEKLQRLPLQLIKYTTTPAKIKAFADRARLEKKMEMLAYLGVDCTITFHPPGWMNMERLREIMDNYLSGSRLKDVGSMYRSKVFVETTKDVMTIHAIMAQNCHSETYLLNRDYTRLALDIIKADDLHPRLKQIDQVRDELQNFKLVLKFILHTILNKNFIESGTAFKERHLLILLYLYIHRNEFVPSETIQEFFQAIGMTKPIITDTLHKLSSSGHVQRFANRFSYSISHGGIQVISAYLSRIVNLSLNA